MGWVEDKIEQLATTAAIEGEKNRLVMEAVLAETKLGRRVAGALARPVIGNAMNYSAGRRLLGWSVLATGGTVRLLLHDGHDTSGDVLAIVDLVDGENETVWLGPTGVAFSEALYIEQTGTGTQTGTVYLGQVDQP